MTARPLDRSSIPRARIALLLVGALVLLVSAVAFLGDLGEFREALSGFRWWYAGPVLGLTVWNYGWRFLKWQGYLGAIGARLPVGLSARVFVAGFAMVLTPGKVGELIKAVYVRRYAGTPVNRTSAVVAAERITDAFAMLALAGIGATRFDHGRAFLTSLGVASVVGIAVIQRPALLTAIVARTTHVPVLGSIAGHAGAFIETSGVVFRPRQLARAVALSVVGWSGECVAFWLVLGGLGFSLSRELLLAATFVLAVSSLAGGASLLPGGLGVADATIAGLLVLTVDEPGMSAGVAAAAAMLIRFATLWFAVILGAGCLASLERREQTREGEEPVQSTGARVEEVTAPGDAAAAGGDGGSL